MKPKLLLIVAAIYMALGGLAYLLLPNTPELHSMASTFMGIAVVDWFARNAEASKARDAIFLGNTVGFGLATILGVNVALEGGPAVSWAFVAANLLLTIGFFLVGRANMSSASA